MLISYCSKKGTDAGPSRKFVRNGIQRLFNLYSITNTETTIIGPVFFQRRMGSMIIPALRQTVSFF
jgi:hypothetical protein